MGPDDISRVELRELSDGAAAQTPFFSYGFAAAAHMENNQNKSYKTRSSAAVRAIHAYMSVIKLSQASSRRTLAGSGGQNRANGGAEAQNR